MRTLTLLFCLALPALCAAQSHEFTVGAGGQFSFNTQSDVGTGFAVQGAYAGRIADFPALDLYIELPVTAAFNINSELPSSVGNADYSSLFITPGLKVKFAPLLPVSPYLTVGGGWARYREENQPGTTDEVRDEGGVFAFGGGMEFKIAPFISLRTDVRDFVSGGIEFNPLADNGTQHNIVATGGLNLRF